MAAITVQNAIPTGIALALAAAAAGGDTAANSRGRTILAVQNNDASSKTVTVPAVQTARPAEGAFPAMTVPNIVVVVAPGATALIGPIPQAYNAANGSFGVTYSAVTDLLVGAFEAV